MLRAFGAGDGRQGGLSNMSKLMISLLLLHADNAGFWAGVQEGGGQAQGLCYRGKHPIEFKGKEAFWISNYARLFVTGNQDWRYRRGSRNEGLPSWTWATPISRTTRTSPQ